MDLVAVEFNIFVHIADGAVDTGAHEALFADVLEDLLVVALLVLDQWRKHLHAHADGHGCDLVDNLLGALRDQRLASDWRELHADAGKHEA